MFYYKLTHEKQQIGIYSSKEKALGAMEVLLKQYAFTGKKEDFKLSLKLSLVKPKMLDQTFWSNGCVNFFF